MSRPLIRLLAVMAVAGAVGCNRQNPQPEPESSPSVDDVAAVEEAENDRQPAEVKTEGVKAAVIERIASVEGARAFFKGPADGAEVTSPVKIEFGLEGMSLVKAGDDSPDSGHHHLIIDAELPPMDQPIPATTNYIHYGDASSESEVELEPGEHKLRLLLGDYRHIPHDPPVMSDEITITVK